jgi:tetratricopeptide (TPR) repeat protein
VQVQRIKKIFSPPTVIFLLTLSIYIHNLSASVYGGDSGDFLSAIAVKGVAHPSGYPLYTLLGILASLLPLQYSLAWKVGLLSSLFSAFAVVVMYKIVEEILKNRYIAVVTSLSLAFLFPFWLFAEISEVFALHSLFLLMLFYCALQLYTKKKIIYLYILSFLTGLSFSNHELTLLMLPSLSILIIATRKKLNASKGIFIKCLGLLLLGLLPYLYIPIAASHNPPINWDNASTTENFVRLVTRADYGWSGIHGKINFSMQLLSLQQYLSYITSNQNLIILALALFGILGTLKKKEHPILLSSLSAFMLFGPLFTFYRGTVNLDNFEAGMSEKFYIASLLFLLILAGYGIIYLADFINRLVSTSQKESWSYLIEKVIIGVCIVIPFWFFISNISYTDLHKIWIGDNFGKDLISPLPKNSYIILDVSESGILGSIDNVHFNSRYMQYVYDIRQDVSLLTRAEFEKNIYKKEKKLNIKEQVLTVVKEYNGLDKQEKLKGVPFGLLFLQKSNRDSNLSKEEYIEQQEQILKGFDKSINRMPTSEALAKLKLIEDIPLWYARAYANTGSYLIDKYQDYEKAKEYFQKALSIDTNTDIAYEGLGDYAFYKNDCRSAEKSYEKATQIGFFNKRFYQKLYRVVNSCLRDKEKSQELQRFFNNYQSIFGDIH